MAQVYYEEKIHPIVSTTSKSTDHYLVDPNFAPSGKIPKSDQAILCMYTEGDIIEYKEDFYRIIPETDTTTVETLFGKKPFQPIIKKVDEKIEVYYRIQRLVDKNTTTGKIKDNYSTIVIQDELITLTKKDKDRIRTIEFNLNKYNSSIYNSSVLNKDCTGRIWKNRQFNSYYPPCLLSLPQTMTLLDDTNIRTNKLIELGQHIRQTHSSELQLFNVKSNPFLYITPEWQLFNFDAAWYIANKYRLIISSEEKMEAWIYSYVHEKNTFYIPCWRIEIDYSKYKYKIYGSSPKSLLSNDILILKSIDGVQYYTTEKLMTIEKKLSDLIVELFYEEPISGISLDRMNDLIHEFESETDPDGNLVRFTLNEQQRIAVRKCLYNRLAIITGFPGTGKSTVMECVFYIRARLNKLNNISVSAPTGIAFTNIFDKLKHVKIGEKKIELDKSASGTTHKCVYVNFPNILNNFLKESDKKHTKEIIGYRPHEEQKERELGMIQLNLCIIDEVSMLDIFIFKRLLGFCKQLGCQLILIGDPNQLSSVGPGAVLKSIIDSCYFENNIAKLNKICRQDTGALLNGILKMANGGVISNTDFDETSLCFRPIHEYEGERFNIRKLFQLFDDNSLTKENTKVICFNSDSKQPINTIDLNIVLQYRYNPAGKVIPSPFEGSSKVSAFRFRVGDIILLTQNGIQENENHEEQYRVNGDEATILGISPDGYINIRYMTDNPTSVTKISTNILYGDYILSYALTVHKAQGSQYDNIVFIPGESTFIKKELVFTAISRAKQKCIVLANMDKFKHSQTNVEVKPTIFMKEFITTNFE
jgi:ATP-dependent exoDNAse (exonuclease V) alpha subunit